MFDYSPNAMEFNALFRNSSFREFKKNEKHINRISDEFVLIIMLDNILYFEENHEEIALYPGEWYIQVPSLQQRGFRESSFAKYYYIHFNGNGLPYEIEENVDVLNKFNNHNLILPKKGNFNINSIMPLLHELEDIKDKSPLNVFELEIILLKIFNCLINEQVYTKDKNEKLVLSIVDFLSKNYTNKIVAKDLEKKFHFSSDYITRLMKKYTGVTPSGFVQNKRIEKSKELLLYTDYTLESISHEIGYSDLSVFFKSFKKVVGIAPGVWRLEKRNYKRNLNESDKMK